MNQSIINNVLALAVKEMMYSRHSDQAFYEKEDSERCLLGKDRKEVLLWCVELIDEGANLSLLEDQIHRYLFIDIDMGYYCEEYVKKFIKAGLKRF